MRTTTSKLIDICWLAAFAVVTTACSHDQDRLPVNEKVVSEESGQKNASSDCDFRTAKVRGKYCQVSVYALLSDPDRYVEKKVFTYGYLIKNEANEFGLYVEPRFRNVPDYASCLVIRNFAKNDDARLADIEPLVIYSVSLGGTFTKSLGDICVGVLSEVDISSFAEEPDGRE